MKSNKKIRLHMSELPVSVELVGPKGESLPFVINPKKKETGMYLNKLEN